MNLKFTNYDLRSAIEKKSGPASAVNRQSSPAHRQSERGIALVITLILLSVTLIMALAFLAISRRERASVTTTTDSSSARLAADAALATAEAQITANAVAGGINALGSPAANPFNFDLLVSTNFINANGFVTGLSAYTNVNYNYSNGSLVSSNLNDYIQLLGNLYYLPRVPVYVPQNGTNDFRFYLDLNRNGEFEDSGSDEAGDPQWIGLLEHPDQPYGPNNKAIARFAFVAVPIGNALDLNYIHNQTLDSPGSSGATSSINPGANTADGFYRNQGVGSWEINLAAFLTDLNLNIWDASASGVYEYNQANPPSLGGASPNTGVAFDDSRALLAYRYNNNYLTLNSASNLFNPNSPSYFDFFANRGVDAYSDLPLQTNFDTNYVVLGGQNPNVPWAGADNTNHFYDEPSDLFNPAVTAIGVPSANNFSERLLAAGTNNSTYDRYTFYRLLSQLGTDSTPETGMMNLNYDNVDYTNNSANPTNFMPWKPIAFFTNAADRMLKLYTASWATNYTANFAGGIIISQGVTNYNFAPVLYTNFVATYNMTNAFGISDIPVYVSNTFVYTPSVNRLLQLAANLYEATSTNYYPSVYRPLFTVTNQNGYTNVFITGFYNVTNVIGTSDLQLAPPIDIATLINPGLNYVNLATNLYGVPWIIGARKGFPNFNESVVESIVGMTRRLQFTRDITGATPNQQLPITGTNQMYMMSLNTSGGLDFWNSYSNKLSDNVTVDWRILSLEYITNNDAPGIVYSVPQSPVGFFASNSISFTGWQGTTPWTGGQPNANSFYVPVNFTALTSLSNSVYRSPNARSTPGAMPAGFPTPSLVPTNYLVNGGPITAVFEQNPPGPPGIFNNPFYIPQWGLLTTNQLQVYILDRDANGFEHIVDYVHLEQASSQNLNNEIFVDDPPPNTNPQGIWNTNLDTKYNIPWGIYNQIKISEGLENLPAEDGTWQGDPEAATYSSSIAVQQADFDAFFLPYGSTSFVRDSYGSAQGSNFEASVQAPYSPTRFAVGYTVLQANDPLVHYLASDLYPSFQVTLPAEYNNLITNIPGPTAQPFTIGKLNNNFQPWGGNPYVNANNNSLTGASVDSLAYSLEERDPLAKLSDDWDFPTNKLPNVGWIGRVHRGTPWQTVYMKSTDILRQAYQLGGGQQKTAGLNVWAQWTGDRDLTYNQYFDANNSAPVQDRLLFDLFTTGINDNATRGQLSVNTAADQYNPFANPTAGMAGWSAVLSGVVIPPALNTTNNYLVINPAGQAGNNSAMGAIVGNINSTRAQYVNPDGVKGTFEHKGDILSAPYLTALPPPYFNSALTNQNNDEIYEWVPQQIMGLLRGQSTPRYVIYCYGQTLKPAPNGIYTGNLTLADVNKTSAFGMVTNYQVTAESATRVVLRIDGLTTNGIPLPPALQHPHAVIESVNPLPPD
jgi:hypothetical protein